uniref:Uncharacterized protein n=1 Tax=Manihot esculenta TaxID=3983 RepID=A0A2C9W083_MANES
MVTCISAFLLWYYTIFLKFKLGLLTCSLKYYRGVEVKKCVMPGVLFCRQFTLNNTSF